MVPIIELQKFLLGLVGSHKGESRSSAVQGKANILRGALTEKTEIAKKLEFWEV